MLLQKLWAFLDWQEVRRNRNCHKNAAKSTREKKKKTVNSFKYKKRTKTEFFCFLQG